MKGVTKRDVRVFLLGMLTMFVVILIYDWKEFVRGINDGIDKRKSIETKK